MDDLITLGILAAAFFGLVVPILSIASFVQGRRTRVELAALRLRLAAVEAGRAWAPVPAAVPEPSAPAAAPTTGPEPIAPESPAGEHAATPSPATKPPKPLWASPPAREGSGLDRFERQVTSRWFVWLGAATLGLAGVFLVKEAAERGWLGPGVRVTLGFLTGLALIAAAEWIRRRFPSAEERGRTDYVPPALSSGGFLFCYASLYAAGQLFGFLTPALTFATMAAVVVAAGMTALRHGAFLALLSAVGGYVLPALISTDQPNGWVLFLYLGALVAGSLELGRRRPWIWLGWIALVGTVAWSLIWIDMPRARATTAPLGLFLVLVLAIVLEMAPLIGRAFPPKEDEKGTPPWREVQYLSVATGIAIACLAFGLVRVDDYGTVGLWTLALVGAILTQAARRHRPVEYLSVVAAVLTVATLATWHLPSILQSYTPVVVERSIAGLGWAPHLPPEATSFLTVVILFGAAYAIAGFVALWGARRPVLWAAISCATPLLLMIAAYWRLARFEIDLHWAASALALAAVALIAAVRIAPYRDQKPLDDVLGLYAAAVTASVSLALTMALRDAWLSVALALELPALAWIHARLPVAGLRVIAGIVAVVLCARLAFNPDVFTYAGAVALGKNWPIYGYGLPLVATYLAWRRFAGAPPDPDVQDWLDAWLRALYFGFAAMLIAFELRILVEESPSPPQGYQLRPPMFAIAWLSLAIGLAQTVERGAGLVRWARRGLIVLAVLGAVWWQINLPIVARSSNTGDWPILNLLLLAYLAPAALMLAFARVARAIEARGFVFTAAGLALLLGFAWVTLETRHAFRGSNLAAGSMSDAESYAYSAVWLVYAAALLAGGLWQKSQALRIGSLIVVMAAVAKVFLVDMDVLTGLWRVASFFGLGLALVAIGFLYQRLVFTRETPPPDAGVSPS